MPITNHTTDINYTARQLKLPLEIIYNSWTYEKLSDPETGLFFQSVGYVYSFLEDELKSAKRI